MPSFGIYSSSSSVSQKKSLKSLTAWYSPVESRTFIFKGYGKGRERSRDVDLRVINIQDTVYKWIVSLDRSIFIYVLSSILRHIIMQTETKFRGQNIHTGEQGTLLCGRDGQCGVKEE